MPESPNRLSQFWQELKRRRVVHVITVYASASFIIIELINNLTEPLRLPPSLATIVIIILVVGFPLAVILSWIYDLTGEGVERTRPISEVPDEQVAKVPNAWKIATYISFVVIIGLVTFHVFGSSKGLKAGDIQSLVVLPFDNYTGDEQLENVVSGMHALLVGDMGRISEVRVLGATTSNAIKDSEMTATEIAAELNVDAVLEASVMCFGDSVCMQFRLVRTTGKEAQLWIADYKEDKSEMLNLNNQITKQIADEIMVELTPEEQQRLAKSRTVDREAYDAYLKGVFHMNIVTYEDTDIAMQYFEQAKEIDPDFALAYSGLAWGWIRLQNMGDVKLSEAAPLSEAAIMKALELDSTISEVHSTLARKKVWIDWDWEGSEESFKKAIEIDPNNTGARQPYSILLNILGRPDEAMQQIEIALELDPLNPHIWWSYGWDLQFAHRFDEAVLAYQEALELNPRHGGALFALDYALYLAGRDQEEVMEALRTFINVYRKDPAFLDILETYYPVGGYPLTYKKIADLIVARSDSFDISPYDISDYYKIAGDIDNAMYWMEKAYEEHDPFMPMLLHPTNDILRDDPRFQEIARKMNLPLPED